jgi:adenosine kinase
LPLYSRKTFQEPTKCAHHKLERSLHRENVSKGHFVAREAEIVFGNRDEFEELANINGFETMDMLLTSLINEYTKTRKKIIVVTDGANPVCFFEGNSSSPTVINGSVDVQQVDASEIVDTTGAGDSFVAGFIYAFMESKDTRECIGKGCEISAKVIKTIGCNLLME